MCFDALMASLWFGFVRTSEKPSVKTLVSEIVLLCTQFPSGSIRWKQSDHGRRPF